MGINLHFNPSTGNVAFTTNGNLQVIDTGDPCVCPPVSPDPTTIPVSLRMNFSGLTFCTNCYVSGSNSEKLDNWDITWGDIDIPYIGNCTYATSGIHELIGDVDFHGWTGDTDCTGTPSQESLGQQVRAAIAVQYTSTELHVTVSHFNNRGVIFTGSVSYSGTSCEFGGELPETVLNDLDECGTEAGNTRTVATGGQVIITETP